MESSERHVIMATKGRSRQKSLFSHVSPISLNSELFINKCEEVLAVCLVLLWSDIVQTRLVGI